MKSKSMKKKVSDTKICLCRDTMIKLFKHLRKTKSGISLMKLIATRTANQFPMKKPLDMRKKPRTAKQKAATRKLVAFNKKRFR
jgi:hypothetical protein